MGMFGCGGTDEVVKVKDLDFTVVATENIPDELEKASNERYCSGNYKSYDKGNYYREEYLLGL